MSSYSRLVCIVLSFLGILFSANVEAQDLLFRAIGGAPTLQTRNASESDGRQLSASINKAVVGAPSVQLAFPLSSAAQLKLTNNNLSTPTGSLISYSFESGRGSVALMYEQGELAEVLVHDVENNEIFRGTYSATNDTIEFVELSVDEFQCDDFPSVEGMPFHASGFTESQMANAPQLSLNQIFNLSSRPGAPNVIYIDYRGGTLTNTHWNDTYNGGNPIVYEAFTSDADSSTYNERDLELMYAGWAEMAEDFAPFNVNITTRLNTFNQTPVAQRSRIIATRTNGWYRDAGGVARLNSFGKGDYTAVGWSFNRTFSSLGMTHSHEAGHQFGLGHDGYNSDSYYAGHGNWGPIMGAPFSKDFVQWSAGDYPGATRTQDDISIIGGLLGFVADDAGDSRGNAAELPRSGSVRLISPASVGRDTDFFRFTHEGGPASITVKSLYAGEIQNGGGVNLSAIVRLRDAGGQVLRQKSPTSDTTQNTFSYAEELAQGEYFLEVKGLSYDANTATGFAEYGNGGLYKISYRIAGGEAEGDILDYLPAIISGALKNKKRGGA